MKRAAGLLLFLALVALAGAAWVDREVHRPYGGYDSGRLVTIETGSGAPGIARLLVQKGVLRGRLPFLALYTLGRRNRRTLKAGEYLVDRPATPLEIYEKIARGDIYYHLVVIPEGSDRFDIARILHQKLGVDPEAFLRVTSVTAAIRDLDRAAPSLEGYLFPDSYRFPRGTTAAEAAETMIGEFRKVLRSDLPRDLAPGSVRLHNMLTLASLVEKETPNASERPLIAGVFERRLAKGMTLDCDPTVAYAVRLEAGLPGSVPTPITESQLRSLSPYNTYRHQGLPPGPICSPGENSIRAALAPASGTALYFVSNRHGGHVFASTLAEHERNVARYRREGDAVVLQTRGRRGKRATIRRSRRNRVGARGSNSGLR